MTPEASRDVPADGDPRPTVIAAGGVVIEEGGPVARVLVVHRPAYDDWTLPKGHVDPGESPEGAALREVAEETGVIARILHAVGTTEHTVVQRTAGPRSEVLKRVHWFLMRPLPDAADPEDRAPDTEIDRASWWPVATALRDLTHAGEQELLRRTLEDG